MEIAEKEELKKIVRLYMQPIVLCIQGYKRFRSVLAAVRGVPGKLFYYK